MNEASPSILLSLQAITEALQHRTLSKAYQCHLFRTIDSSNRYLKDLAPSSLIDICCTESQTAGRGRFGRPWHSPFGENVYCSIRWSLRHKPAKLAGLSLVSSLSVLACLREFIDTKEIQLKWPNDILWRDKKLSGSLIELQAGLDGQIQVIIGIGLNVNTDTKNQTLEDKAWCSLFEISEKTFNRNLIIASLIVHLDTYLNRFLSEGLSSFLNEWKQHDYLAGKTITLSQSGTTIQGVVKGIDQSGLLILEDRLGQNHLLSSGDTSLAKHGQDSQESSKSG